MNYAAQRHVRFAKELPQMLCVISFSFTLGMLLPGNPGPELISCAAAFAVAALSFLPAKRLMVKTTYAMAVLVVAILAVSFVAGILAR